MPRIDGRTKTRLYRIYKAMRTRCYNPNSPAYKYYGKRGIKICDEWLNDFTKFKSWALSNGYNDSLSIDRINVNGDYEPSNCRWANNQTQTANRRPQATEYVGVHLSSSGSTYCATIRVHNQRTLFSFYSRSKNECARRRNDFIIENHLENKYVLNDVKEEYDDVRIPENEFDYYAFSRKNPTTIIFARSEKELAEKIDVDQGQICRYLHCQRKNPNYIIAKERRYENTNDRHTGEAKSDQKKY